MTDSRVLLERAVSGVLALTLVAAIAGLVYFVVAPVPATTADTGFYVLGPSGMAGNYSNATVDEPKEYVVGIHNQEHERVSYRVVVEQDDKVLKELSPIVQEGTKWEERISVTFESTGKKRLDILLYKDGGSSPYRELYVKVDVTGQ